MSEYRGGDATYHGRHHRRTLERAAAIARNIAPGGTFLDAGCNQGLTSRHLLQGDIVRHATGIELARSTVDERLLGDSRFRLIESNLCDVELDETFDRVFYGAVHHHILRERGLTEAVRVLRHLVSHCRSALFFETGHITEGGRWAWQRALRRYFRTDEEHLFYLLRCVEEQLADFEVIGRYWIHGARRWLLRLDLKPLEQRALPDPPLPRTAAVSCEAPTLARTFGSRDQRLVPFAERAADSPVELRLTPAANGTAASFSKRAIHSPISQHQEAALGLAIDAPWAVRPTALSVNGALVFPRISGDSILAFAHYPADLRNALIEQLLAIWDEAASMHPVFPQNLLLPAASGTALIDVVDFNPQNLLVDESDDRPRLRVVDFEPHGNHYRWKNRIHLGRVLLTLRRRRTRALMEILAGAAGGLAHTVRYQFASPRRRLRDRQPSLTSLLVAECRSRVEGLAARIIPSLDEL